MQTNILSSYVSKFLPILENIVIAISNRQKNTGLQNYLSVYLSA